MTSPEEGWLAGEDSGLLDALQSASADAVVVVGLNGTVRSWNRAAEQLFGYSTDEMVGSHVRAIIPTGEEDEMFRRLHQLARGETVPNHEATRRTKAGALVEVATRMTAVTHPELGVMSVLIIDRDLTEERWLASTLDATLSDLREMVEQARASEDRSRRFLADAAHQLRSPIASLQLCTEALLKGVAPADQDRLFSDLVRQTERAGRLVGGLLRMARIDEGEALAPEPCDLLELCQEQADRIWHLAPHLDVVVRAQESDGDPPRVDPGAVGEILANLMENALRYAQSRITVEVTRLDKRVEIRVSDDGPGVPPGAEESAFERFATFGDKGGSGLGLPIARELARAHGGGLIYEEGEFVAWFPVGNEED